MTARVLVAALPLVLAACGTSSEAGSAAPSTDLTGTSWILVEMDAADSTTGPGVLGDAELTLTFGDGGEAFGSTGCNRFTAQWSQDGQALSIDVGAVTQAACATDALQSQEAAYLRALASVETSEVTDDSLTLAAPDNAATLTFEAALTDLAGSSWEATGINNQSGGVESTALTASVTADFSQDGALSGFSGCRPYTADYESTAAGEITVGGVTPDGPECGQEAAALEANYVAALENAVTYSIEGSTLNLRDTGGATQVNYSLRR